MLLLVTSVMVVLTASFLCSIFESVLLSLTRPQVELMVQQNRRAGRLLAGFKENMDVPIAAILILNTAAHTIGAAVAGASYTGVYGTSTLWVFSLLFTVAVLLFTEIIPKTLGVSYARALASPVAFGIHWLTRLLRPLVVVSERISRSLRRGGEVPVTSVEEIRLLASLGRSAGVVGVKTAGMIVGATQLRHMQAHDVVVPRESVRFLCPRMDRQQVLNAVRESGFSRFPYSPSTDLDEVSGVVMARDLLTWMLENREGPIDWAALAREPLVVPASMPLITLLRTFQDTRRHMALVVDEYGNVEGIATLEDVMEEIVGDIWDESDRPVKEVDETGDGVLEVSGRLDMRKLCARLGVSWDPDIEPTTVGGLVLESLGRIPEPGEWVEWNGFRIEVIRSDGRRVRRLRVSRQAEAD